jgi:hypothetical protein
MTRTELIAALKSAKGPDARLDVLIDNFLGLAKWRYIPRIDGDGEQVRITPAAYTTSIDAAVALIESVRPETLWAVYSGGEAEVDDETGIATVGARAATPAIALVLALLESMEDK